MPADILKLPLQIFTSVFDFVIFIKYLWSGCFVPGIVLITGDIILNKTDLNFFSAGVYNLIYFSSGEQENLRIILMYGMWVKCFRQ